MKQTFLTLGALLLTTPLAYAQASTVATNVSVNVATEAALTLQTANTSLTSAGTSFSDYTGTTNFTYFVRTSQSTGSGAITLKVTTDFAPAGGPSVATPLTASDKLTYTCTVPTASSGTVTQCSGSQTSSTSSSTNVATFGADTRSPKAGVASSVAWDLTNDPSYQAGLYTAVVTLTISAA